MLQLDKTTYYRFERTGEVAEGQEWMQLLNELLADYEAVIDDDDFVEVCKDRSGDWVEVKEEGCRCFGGCNWCLCVTY